MVGLYTDASGTHGFLFSGGIYTRLNAPGATSTFAYGNASGQIVGTYVDASGGIHGFLFSGGNYIPINVPGAMSTDAVGINGSGQIVGDYDDASGGHGFLATPVPEPGTLTLTVFGVGLIDHAWQQRKRQAVTKGKA
jgi:uncharacterized membrane protein